MRIWAAMCVVLGLAACVPGAEDEAVVDHHRPEDPGLDVLQQGLVTCAPRSTTGYRAGESFAIVVVNADGKPAEVRTANAYHLMQAAAARDGVQLRVISGFRSQAEQEYLYACYVNCSCNDCNLAAYPGYSNHQSGYALDLNTHEAGVYTWLTRNAARFGFARTVPSEDWHWERVSAGPAGGPCAEDGTPVAPPGPSLRFLTPREGGRYQNGVWLKAAVDAEVALVRYFADGWYLGASEDAGDDFAVRYTFNTLGRRKLTAEAVDATGRKVASTSVTVEVTAGATAAGQVDFVSPRQDGWYRNGLDLRTRVTGPVHAVTYSAGAYVLGRSTDAADGFRVRYTFNTLGPRAILAVATDAAGQEVARRAIAIRVMPGEEGPVAVRFLAPQADGRYSGPVSVAAVGSASVRRVVYSADGWTFGTSTDSAGNFPVSYTFNQKGPRKLRVEGFDAAGTLVAQDEVEVEVR
jgi:hypothetical protein